MKLFSKKSGFTIIEMLVVTAIIVIISAFMAVNFRKGEEGHKLQRSAQLIVQSIRRAQNMAISSTQHLGDVPPAYGVFFNDNQDFYSYILFADLNGNNKYDNPASDSVIATIVLEKGIKILSVSLSPRLHIVFVPPDPSTIFNNNPGINQVTITIKKEGATCPSVNCRNIKVKNTGWMTIE